MCIHPSVLSPRMLKHVRWASQQLAQGLLTSPIPVTGRTFFFLFLSSYYSLLEWGNVVSLRALCCCVCGLRYGDHAAVALQRCRSHVVLPQSTMYHWQLILWLGFWVPG